MPLSGPLKEKLNNAIVSAYPSYPVLEFMLAHRLDKPLPSISPPAAMPLVVFELIKDAEAKGWTAALVAKAVEANPGNVDLFEVSQELGMTPMSGALQRTINQATGFIDMAQLIENLTLTQGRICRVEIPIAGGTVFGTGFLVGPDAVLTNYHVVKPVVDGKCAVKDVGLRFDYRTLLGGKLVHPGTLFRLADEWLIDHCPPDPLDFIASAENSSPDPDHLDYALVRLSSAAGNKAVGGKAEPGARLRGCIQLPTTSPAISEETAIFIVQHPAGEPIKLAVETTAKTVVNGNRTRVRHRTNTAGGSSGSPCFDKDWNLLALHHAGDPNFMQEAQYNQGVMIDLVRRRIDDKAPTANLAC